MLAHHAHTSSVLLLQSSISSRGGACRLLQYHERNRTGTALPA